MTIKAVPGAHLQVTCTNCNATKTYCAKSDTEDVAMLKATHAFKVANWFCEVTDFTARSVGVGRWYCASCYRLTRR